MFRTIHTTYARFLFSLLLGALLIAVTCLAFLPSKRNVTAQRNASRQAPPRPKPQRTTQTIYAPIAGLPESAGAELALNNNGPEMMEVTPTFYAVNGNPYVGTKITLGPTEVRHININNILPADLRNLFRFGGLRLSYIGAMMEVVAQITLFGRANAGSVDIPFSAAMDYQSTTQEAVWWSPRNSVATIILGNDSDVPVVADLIFSSGQSEKVSLAPRGTGIVEHRVTERPGDFPDSVRIQGDGPVGSLRATGYVRTNDNKFTSGILFYDPKTIRQPHLFATNLRLAQTEPRMVLKNIGETALTARPRFLPAGGGSANPLEPAPIVIAPRQVVEVDLRQLVSLAATHNDFRTVSVQVVNSGATGSLIGAICATDNTKQVTHTVPLRDSGPKRNSTGGYPWKIEDDYTSIISITNAGDAPSKFIACVNFKNGKYSLPEKELAVGETVFFDLRKLRDQQTQDKDGKTIPLTVTSGQFHWSLIKGTESARLIGRTEVVSLSNNVSSSFSCGVCCQDSGPYPRFSPDSLVIAVNGFANLNGLGDYVNCYSQVVYTGNDYIRNWACSNPSVIGMDVTEGYSNTVTGLTSGYSDFSGTGEDIYIWEEGAGDCYRNIWDDPGVAGESTVVQVTNVTAMGATKVTSVVGDQSIIHFVTPKGASGENVTLTASITPNDQQSINQISWDGATQNPSNKLQATVSKSSASKKIVKIKVGNQTAKELRVWIAWATISSADIPIVYEEPVSTINGTGANVTGGYNFTHTIQPASIITDADRPDLSGSNTVAVPGGNHWTGDPLSGGANRKWDNSRQMRTRWLLSSGLSPSDFSSPPLPDGITYPTNDIEGNDDRSTGDETNDPYANSGTLTGSDSPSLPAAHSKGSNGDAIELRFHFREFTRLEIEGVWYRISDYYLWRIHLKLQKTSGKWVNNGTNKALNNNGF